MSTDKKQDPGNDKMEEFLSNIWDAIGNFFGGFASTFEKAITAIFGSSNARYLRSLDPIVETIGTLEEKYEKLSDEELKEQTERFRARLKKGETLDDLLPEAFAVVREAGKRFLNMRHYDVQLIGGMVLHSGKIAEMVTGEGKTLVATLPAYLNALAGGVHVVTVNDYLARRDMEWMAPLYMNLGLTVGVIQSGMETAERQKSYECDITYGTNNEFGFDYLRDNMRPAAKDDEEFHKESQQSQGRLQFAIIDEVDNILVDEARTPLIISGPAEDDVTKYSHAHKIAKQLQKDLHFEVNEKDQSVNLNDEGVRQAEKLVGVESFYTAGNMHWPHLIDNSLRALHLYKRDVNYVVQQDGEICIVDEFTGRLMSGRRWSDGLHQAVEAKEGVPINRENQTLATVTLQNFFKLYDKLSGMTGTAMTEADEFLKIYGLEVVAIPTNKPMLRKNFADDIYLTELDKFSALANDVERTHRWDIITFPDGAESLGNIESEDETSIDFVKKGQKKPEKIAKDRIASINRKGRPILIGTVSIERSEKLSALLQKRGVKHEVLNAKHHKREAEIVSQAGRKGAVTIATNMAGRGTDIVLGGNPEAMAWALLQDKYATRLDVPDEEWTTLVKEIDEREGMTPEGDEVRDLGGLKIMGTERHEARRIDLQLQGRCGRQGDPGSSMFFLSLEDDLMRIFGGEWFKRIFQMGVQEGEGLKSKMLTRRIEGAQKKVEERNFEIRKSLLEYDEVMDEQRKRVYGYRQDILNGTNCKALILEMIREQVEYHTAQYLDPSFGTETFVTWASSELGVELPDREFRGMRFEEAQDYAKDCAERIAEAQIQDLIEENMPEDSDESDWNWTAFTNTLNSRWAVGLKEREVRKIQHSDMIETILPQVSKVLQSTSLLYGERYLDADYGYLRLSRWLHDKFGINIAIDEIKELDDVETVVEKIYAEAAALYDEKDVQYPVASAFWHLSRTPTGEGPVNRDGLAEWVAWRLDTQLSVEELQKMQRQEMFETVIEASRKFCAKAQKAYEEMDAKIDELTGGKNLSERSIRDAYNSGELEKLCDWLNETYESRMTQDDIYKMDPMRIANKLESLVERRYRPEMRYMERNLLLQWVDSSWKEHLLTMDYLRSSVRMRSYAQVDPKVEYKREGMRVFETMWRTIGERVTDLIFRMEEVQQEQQPQPQNVLAEVEEQHSEAEGAISSFASEGQDAANSSQAPKKTETIRNKGEKVGRNSPCPCGSGKKFKNCCG